MVIAKLFRLYILSITNSREEQPVPYPSSLSKANYKVLVINHSSPSTDKILLMKHLKSLELMSSSKTSKLRVLVIRYLPTCLF